MVTILDFQKYALALEDAEEQPHFDKTSFRVRKKIFATLDVKNKTVVLKFNEIDQSIFCGIDASMIYPVKGKWGLKGWTVVELNKVEHELLVDALTISYCNVAPNALASKYQK